MRKSLGMKIILQAVTLALFVSTASADEPLGFKGVPFGATKEVLLKKHPKFKCFDTPGAVGRDTSCNLDSGTYAGVDAKVRIDFYSNSFEGAYITFDSANFYDVKDALITKHGKPTMNNETFKWLPKGGGNIVMINRGDESDVFFFSAAHDKEFTKRIERDKQVKSGDL